MVDSGVNAQEDIPNFGLEYYVQLGGEMFLTFFEADDGLFGKAVVNSKGIRKHYNDNSDYQL